MDQTVFGELIEVAQGTVARWESGDSKPRIDSLLKLAKLAGCSPDELVTRLLDDDTMLPAGAHNSAGAVLLPVLLPNEDALLAMFSGLLTPLQSEHDFDVIARRLAQMLPSALAQAATRFVWRPVDRETLLLPSSNAEPRSPKNHGK
jgi:transcriptional regulator with XRE-family HTH domain